MFTKEANTDLHNLGKKKQHLKSCLKQKPWCLRPKGSLQASQSATKELNIWNSRELQLENKHHYMSLRRKFLVQHPPYNEIRKTKQDGETSRISHHHLEEETAGQIMEVSIYANQVTEKKHESIFHSFFGAELWLIALSLRKRFTIENNEANHCLNLWEETEAPQIYTLILSWDSSWLCEVSRAPWWDTKPGYLFYCWFGLYIIQYNRHRVLKICV